MGQHFLDRLFSPRSIAVFGASEKPDSVGSRVYENLLAGGFPGPIYPVNPKYERLGHRRCYGSVGDIGQLVDLAVIATPAQGVPRIIHECGEHGVRGAIVLSAGFGEVDVAGARHLRELMREAHRYRMRIVGPDCLGLIRPSSGLNATFSKNSALEGALALISQSGALCTAILDWAQRHNVGFSAVVSLGNASDVNFGDILDFLALDPHTHSILLYVEGVGDARDFMSGLRSAARMKPVVVLKAGRRAAGSRAAVSHTGALVGTNDVFEAALQRAGAVRAMSIEQLFAAAQLLATRHGRCGDRLAIITNGGGPGVMATDRAMDLGLQVPELDDTTIARLNAVLPAQWSHGNPIDILGDATPARFRSALEACLSSPVIDGVLVMLAPQAMTRPLETAQAVIDTTGHSAKPVLACWMGEAQVEEAWMLFSTNKVPVFPSPEASIEAFSYLVNYHRNQQMLLQVPGPLGPHTAPDIEGGRMIVEAALAAHRSVLSESETRALLAAFKIPVNPAVQTHSPNEALVAAESLGLPVAMKICSQDINHKSDCDGVRLNISHAQAVRSTYNEIITAVRERLPSAQIDGVSVEPMVRSPHARELLVGVIRDEVFGPVINFGSGGTAVEVMRDRAVALPPLNSYIARDMIHQTRISQLLGRYRNMPAVNLDAVIGVLRRVSELACEIACIRELEINPLIADEAGVLVVDARVVVDLEPPGAEHYEHMAIHPYPHHLVSRWQLADGTDITIRPIRPEDAEIEQAFVRGLSPEAKYLRFMTGLRELSMEMLVRLTQIDYDREMALIAVTGQDDKEVELAVARYAMNPDGESCEFALVVADAWQKKGLGSRLTGCLMEAAHAKGYKTMEGAVLAENNHMLQLAHKLGFSIEANPEDSSLRIIRKNL
jgi:acetyltransferase